MRVSIDLPPGVYRNGTERQSQGRYYDTNLVRWIDRSLAPVGGWRSRSDDTLGGKARAAIAWKDNAQRTWLGVGTHSKLYASNRTGDIYNITPFEASGTLGSNPIDTASGTPTITITHTSHGRQVGDTIVLAGATAVGGVTVNGTWVVATVPDANTYTFTFTSNASSTANGGGAAVTYEYEMSPGDADASATGGYGFGSYGSAGYGTPRPDDTLITDASVWTLDTWGEYMVGVRDDNGTIVEWQTDTADRAEPVTNAPTANALVVTEKRILMAIGADDVPRRVSWSDQEDNTVWTPAATNQAGSFDLQTAGRGMCARNVRGGVLILTDTDAHRATYTADNNVYAFEKIGDKCGILSRQAIGVFGDGRSAWMSRDGFWIYSGFVEKLKCDVLDYILSDINLGQVSKVSAVVNSAFSEVTWYYCSVNSTEVDRYVTWNYVDNYWIIGALSRLCGVDKGVFTYPILIDADGNILEHEVGFDYDDEEPYAEGGPLRLGEGDRIMYANYYWPDEETAGDATVTFKVKDAPNSTEVSYGPYTAANPQGIRFAGRQFKVRYTFVANTGSRIGVPQIEVKPGGKR